LIHLSIGAHHGPQNPIDAVNAVPRLNATTTNAPTMKQELP
jgi:hypothetical protein